MRPWVKSFTVFAVFFHLVSISAAKQWTTLTLVTNQDSVVVHVEIADTPSLRNKGLMFREDLTQGQGMLFIFPDEAIRSFWMKNTPLSLDILFFDADGQFLGAQYSTTPFSTKSLQSPAPAQYALEVLAGEAKRLGISNKTVLKWP